LTLYNPSAGTMQKTQLEKACLLICCLAIDVLFLRAYASARICLPGRCLAMGLYVKKLSHILLKIMIQFNVQTLFKNNKSDEVDNDNEGNNNKVKHRIQVVHNPASYSEGSDFSSWAEDEPLGTSLYIPASTLNQVTTASFQVFFNWLFNVRPIMLHCIISIMEIVIISK
jgi:hypothetical protein